MGPAAVLNAPATALSAPADAHLRFEGPRKCVGIDRSCATIFHILITRRLSLSLFHSLSLSLFYIKRYIKRHNFFQNIQNESRKRGNLSLPLSGQDKLPLFLASFCIF